jgi:hypothetical protein
MENEQHAAEPKADSFRTADGREADLFLLAHYPIDAVCRICGGAIRARSFVLPFEHVATSPAQVPRPRSGHEDRPAPSPNSSSGPCASAGKGLRAA